MNHDFQTSLAFVLLAEGGFSDTTGDRGGATNHGVTQATYSSWLRSRGMADAPVASISPEYVESVYLDLYWLAGNCDKLPSPTNLIHFDACVNHGIGSARSMLLSATAFVGAELEQEAFAYLCLRHNLYNRIVAKDPVQGKFLRGWLNRLAHLRTAAGLDAPPSPPLA